MNYKLDGIPISNYGAKPVRTNQAFALHGMLDLPKRLSPTEYNWGTSIEPFVDAEDIKLDGRTLTLNVAIKSENLDAFVQACISCNVLSVEDDSVNGRNLLSSNFDRYTIGQPYNYMELVNESVDKTISIFDKDLSIPMTDMYFGLTKNGYNYTSGGVWMVDRGNIRHPILRPSVDYNSYYYFSYYMNNRVMFDKIFKRFYIKAELGDNPNSIWTPAPEDIFFPHPVLCRDEIKVNKVKDYAIVSVPFWQDQVTYNPVTILPSNTGEVRIDGYYLAKDFGIYIASSNELDSVAKRIEVQTTEMYSRTNFRATRTIDLNCTMKVFNTTDLFYKMNEFQSMLMMPGLREFKIRDKNYYVYFKDGMNVEVVANNIAKFNLKATVV